MNNINTIVLLAAFVCLTIAPRLINAAEGRITGTSAPDFVLADLSHPDRKAYRLSDNFNGESNHAVVICFFASWCSVCLEELKLMKSLTDSLYKGKVTMVAVSIDNGYGPKQQLFVKSAGLTCSVVLDTQRLVAKQYRIKGRLPYSVFITKNGIVYTTVSGYGIRAERYIYLTLEKMVGPDKK